MATVPKRPTPKPFAQTTHTPHDTTPRVPGQNRKA